MTLQTSFLACDAADMSVAWHNGHVCPTWFVGCVGCFGGLGPDLAQGHQARSLCWLALLAEAHEDQASDAERRGDTEQAMGWFADAMRLRDAIQVVTTIEIPLPATTDEAEEDDDQSMAA